MYKLSIIIPVYGVEEYLPKCLDSVYSQATSDCQIILVDDGSPDNCGNICEEYRARYPEHTTVIHQKNAGLGGARNTGINACDGEFLMFIDSDDTITSDAISTVLYGIEKYNADITVFPLKSIDEDGSLISVHTDVFEQNKVLYPQSSPELITGNPVAWNKIVRKSIFVDNGIEFPSRVWYEDIRTTPKLIACADTIVYLEKPLYNYLRREGSIMNSAKLDRNIEIVHALDDLKDWFLAKGLFSTYEKELEYLMLDHVFVSATVRILRADSKKHPLVSTFREYAEKNCPYFSGGENHYMSSVLPKNRRIIYKLLKKKLYFAVKLIFKIKG
ncbi:MAG: glycosyltransferase [Clostridia bacterium]|nr:glycosyltransferase [Clostridia bacterium]